MKERWKPVVGFAGLYEVSDQGRVRSLGRTDSLGRKWPGCILRLGRAGRGYAKVDLRRSGQYYTLYVHRVVLTAFRGVCPRGCEGAHKDGDIGNNSLGNLAWKTHAANEKDKVLHGTQLVGVKHWNAKLTEADVRRVRAGKETPERLAAALGVSSRHIRGIRRGRTWRAVA